MSSEEKGGTEEVLRDIPAVDVGGQQTVDSEPVDDDDFARARVARDEAIATRVDTGLNRAFTLTLPSRGVLYGELLPDGKIEVRPLTTAEESILYSPAGSGIEKVSKLIDSCVVSRTMNPGDLLLTDRFYILMALRTRSLSAEYSFLVRCQDCGQKFRKTINLAEDLDIKRMEDDMIEPFEVKLPDAGDTIHLRFLRGRDELKVAQYAKRMRLQSTDPGDPSYIYRLATQVVQINGKDVNLKRAQDYIGQLLSKDSNAMRLATEERESGVDTRLIIDCRACGSENEAEMPFDVEFFRPSSVGGI